MIVLGITCAGALGAVAARGGRHRGVGPGAPHLPFGTLTINVSGSFVLGVITGLALYHGLESTPKIVVGTGFCGGYTTFSTFA